MNTPLEDNQLPTTTENLNFIEVKPKPEFYSTFSEEEISEIINYLDLEKAVPLKYCYIGKSAEIWDNFIVEFGKNKQDKSTNNEGELLKESWNYINYKIPNNTKINVIEIGQGNSYPVKDFISQVVSLGRINSYVAIDLSQEMLNISQENILQWFPEVKFLGHKCDIEKDLLSKIISEYKCDSDNIINVIISIGGTIQNHQDRCKILKNIKMGMAKNDLFLFTFDMGSHINWDGKLSDGGSFYMNKLYKYLTDVLGIKREDSELIVKFNSAIDCRVARIKLKENYCLKFNIQSESKKVLLFKDEEINIWKHHWSTILETLTEIEQSGLQLIHLSKNRESSEVSEVIVICQAVSI